MPQYPFQSRTTGELREFAYAMREVPSIGDTVERDGDTWVRLVSDFVQGVEPARSRYPIESISLPPTIPECKLSARGRPIVRSHEHAQAIASKYGFTYDP